jgi:four helix bundle protein
MKYSFEKLDAWIMSKDLVKDIYILTRNFPKEELFGLTSQIRRASVSIASNLAEGSSRTSPKDQVRFYVISFSSLVEVINQLIISHDSGFVSNEDYIKLRSKIEKLSNFINSLRQSVSNKIK